MVELWEAKGWPEDMNQCGLHFLANNREIELGLIRCLDGITKSDNVGEVGGIISNSLDLDLDLDLDLLLLAE